MPAQIEPWSRNWTLASLRRSLVGETNWGPKIHGLLLKKQVVVCKSWFYLICLQYCPVWNSDPKEWVKLWQALGKFCSGKMTWVQEYFFLKKRVVVCKNLVLLFPRCVGIPLRTPVQFGPWSPSQTLASLRRFLVGRNELGPLKIGPQGHPQPP